MARDEGSGTAAVPTVPNVKLSIASNVSPGPIIVKLRKSPMSDVQPKKVELSFRAVKLPLATVPNESLRS